MSTSFWIGQVSWLAVVACGAYLAFCFWNLSNEERARQLEMERAGRAGEPAGGVSVLIAALDGEAPGVVAWQQHPDRQAVNIPHAVPPTIRYARPVRDL